MLRIGILEDNSEILHNLKNIIEEKQLAEVAIASLNSDDFLKSPGLELLDAVLLDIHLLNDTLTGLEVAQRVKKPVLFITSYTRDNIDKLEELEAEFDFPVEHLTKPWSETKLLKILDKFLEEVRKYRQAATVVLDFKENKNVRVFLRDIVFIDSDKKKGSSSNNKVMYFTNRKPEVLVNFPFRNMEKIGLDDKRFVELHRSQRVNVDHIEEFNKKERKVIVKARDEEGKLTTFERPVSEDKISWLSRRLSGK